MFFIKSLKDVSMPRLGPIKIKNADPDHNETLVLKGLSGQIRIEYALISTWNATGLFICTIISLFLIGF